jgi:hypothetical protein
MDIKGKLDEILLLEWSDEDKKVLENTMKTLLFYKHFIPKKLLIEILECLDICIREKKLLDTIKKTLE